MQRVGARKPFQHVDGLPFVQVCCDAPSHSRWWLIAIVITDTGGMVAAMGVEDSPGNNMMGRGTTHRNGSGVAVRRNLDDADNLTDPGDPGIRSSWQFKCERCGDSITFRDERLRPIVDRLVAHGVREISLAGLRVAMGQ